MSGPPARPDPAHASVFAAKQPTELKKLQSRWVDELGQTAVDVEGCVKQVTTFHSPPFYFPATLITPPTYALV